MLRPLDEIYGQKDHPESYNVVCFDIGQTHFAWTMMSFSGKEDDLGKIISIDCHDISDGKGKKAEIMNLRKNMIILLNNYLEYWDMCDEFVVESQYLVKGGVGNIRAVKLAEVCLTYFLTQYDHDLVQISSFGGSKIAPLGGPKTLKRKKDRKDWTIAYTRERLSIAYPPDVIELFESSEFKKDDMSDCFCMCLIKANRHYKR